MIFFQMDVFCGSIFCQSMVICPPPDSLLRAKLIAKGLTKGRTILYSAKNSQKPMKLKKLWSVGRRGASGGLTVNPPLQCKISEI